MTCGGTGAPRVGCGCSFCRLLRPSVVAVRADKPPPLGDEEDTAHVVFYGKPSPPRYGSWPAS